MVTIPQFAPGCFGSAFGFKDNDTVCNGCVFREQCAPAHRLATAALRKSFGIQSLEERNEEKAAEIAERRRAQDEARLAADPGLLSLPIKVQDLIARLDRGNYDVIGKLAAGLNPFADTIPFLRIACHLLLHFDRPINKDLLVAAFSQKLDWKPNTAEAHARMTIMALTHIGAVDNQDGQITLRRRG